MFPASPPPPIRALLAGISGLVLLLWAAGCTGIGSGVVDAPGDSGPIFGDLDGDGYTGDADCDDADASIHPGALELCDGLDQDCDDQVDENALDAATFYADADSDGHGDPGSPIRGCEPSEGYVSPAGDCNDADPTVYLGAAEVCDAVDNDCDGAIDEGVGETWYLDADGDGFGDEAVSRQGCDPGGSYVPAPSDGRFDCNDLDPAFHPDAAETDCTDRNDYDCDGSTPWADDDADGSAACLDCDDHDSRAEPVAAEVCDGIDNDCDGLVDDDDSEVGGTLVFYADGDHDGYGLDTSTTTACLAPEGFVGVGGDCDDGDARIHPGAGETDCSDPTDYNCDGSIGWADADADGTPACSDCNDADPSVHPGASETCNGTDDDCDALIDDDDPDVVGTHVFYADADADGYGSALSRTEACLAPDGFVSVISGVFDCDDADVSINVERVFYLDADGDGWGDDAVSGVDCFAPEGYVSEAGDCNDGDPAFYPGASETDCTDPNDYDCSGTTSYVDTDGDGFAACEDCDDTNRDVFPSAMESCNGIDDDCDGLADDDDPGVIGTSTWFLDADGDTYGDGGVSVGTCIAPPSYVPDSTDCDDTEPSINPASTEICGDDLDQDCDGTECPSTGDVIFTEIMQNPSATADSVGEWFELSNVSSWKMDLSGFQIRDDATDHFTIPDGTVVDSGDAIVFVRTSDGMTSPVPDVVWADLGTMQLANATDSLSLASAAGTLVDAVFWDGGLTFPDPEGSAMSLDPAFYDDVSNDVGTNWCEAPTDATYTPADHGTPGETNPSCGFSEPIPPDTGG
jgi:large repetitive protein